MMTIRCDVVDDNGEIIIQGGELLREVSADVDCRVATDVVIKYYKNTDDAFVEENPIIAIFPKKRVRYFKIEI